MRYMKRYLVGALLIVIVAFILRWQSFSPADIAAARVGPDSADITHAVRAGCPLWVWPHPGSPSLRPVSAVIYHYQVRLNDAGYEVVSIAVNVVLWALIAFCAAGITYQLTQRLASAVIAAALILPAQSHYFHVMRILDCDVLGYWPTSDNLLCLLGMMTCLWALVVWLQHRRTVALVVSFVALAAACLSKEAAYILPALAWCAVWFGQSREQCRRADWYAVAGMFATVAAIALYRTLTIETPYNSGAYAIAPRGLFALIQENNFWLWRIAIDGFPDILASVIASPLAALWGLAQFVLVWLCTRYLWHARGYRPVLLSLLWSLLICVPLLTFGLFGFRLLFPWVMVGILAGAALDTLCRHKLREFHPCASNPRHLTSAVECESATPRRQPAA